MASFTYPSSHFAMKSPARTLYLARVDGVRVNARYVVRYTC